MSEERTRYNCGICKAENKCSLLDEKATILPNEDVIKNAFKKIYEYVGDTYGYLGKNVIILKDKNMKPYATKDGVTVMKNLAELEQDLAVKAVARIVEDISIQTDKKVGDGTTTTVIFAYLLYSALEKYRQTSGQMASKSVERQIQEMLSKVIRDVEKKHSYSIKSIEEIENIALLSSNFDKEITTIIKEATDKIGKEGLITISPVGNLNGHTTMDIKEGAQFDCGYSSKVFVNNLNDYSFECEDAYFLVTDDNLRTIKDILPVLEVVANADVPLIIVANSIKEELLAGLITNVSSGKLKVISVEPRYYNEDRDNFFKDLSVLTGAKFFSKTEKFKFTDFSIKSLGRSERVKITAGNMIVVGGYGKKSDIEDHLDKLTELMNRSGITEEIAVQIMERKARFSSSVAEITIGGFTESEVREKKYRLEDALNAVSSSIKNGFVVGGAKVYALLGRELINQAKQEKDDIKKKTYEILSGVFYDVFYRLIQVSPGAEQKLWGEDVEKIFIDETTGIDLRTFQLTNLLKGGIIEPFSIFKNVMLNSQAIVNILLNTSKLLLPVEGGEL